MSMKGASSTGLNVGICAMHGTENTLKGTNAILMNKYISCVLLTQSYHFLPRMNICQVGNSYLKSEKFEVFNQNFV